MVVMLRQCCCGCTLKTGAIIIGVLNVLGGLAELSRGIAGASGGKQTGSVGQSATVAVLGAILLLVAICLIVGAVKDKPALLVPWMVYGIVYLIGITILYIIVASLFFAHGNAAGGASFIIALVIIVLLEVYFLLVVYSLYRELKGTAPPSHA